MRGERRLDLAELDAEAAHLDLVVDPAEELELAVRPVAREVAGAVEALARRAERVGHEALGGQLRPVEVAAGEAGAAQAELAGTPRGAGLPARSST